MPRRALVPNRTAVWLRGRTGLGDARTIGQEIKDPDGLDDGRRTIVVGGGKALTEQAGRLQHSEIRRSDEDCSIGVLKALHLHLVEITGEDD